MSRVGVIGHFGLGLDLLNGQTIKTKIITEEIKNYCKEDVYLVDSYGGIKAVLPVIWGCIKALKTCRNIIIMLNKNGLRVVVPLISLFNKIFHRRIHYVVVGGWLPEFLEKRIWLAKRLKKFFAIYVETASMKLSLYEMGVCNVVVMPNCKRLDIIDELSFCDGPYKLCTFSRVMKEKGIEDAVEAVKMANSRLKTIAFTLDIYGQIDSSQTEWFERLADSFPEYIKYEGVVDFNKSTQVLKSYFALIFPTYYEGEGFAGTAIDAFSAGIPVIASNWKYNCEVIKSGVTGTLFEPHDIQKLADILISLFNNPNEWNKMKKNCLREAYNYRPENAMKILFDNL